MRPQRWPKQRALFRISSPSLARAGPLTQVNVPRLKDTRDHPSSRVECQISACEKLLIDYFHEMVEKRSESELEF